MSHRRVARSAATSDAARRRGSPRSRPSIHDAPLDGPTPRRNCRRPVRDRRSVHRPAICSRRASTPRRVRRFATVVGRRRSVVCGGVGRVRGRLEQRARRRSDACDANRAPPRHREPANGRPRPSRSNWSRWDTNATAIDLTVRGVVRNPAVGHGTRSPHRGRARIQRATADSSPAAAPPSTRRRLRPAAKRRSRSPSRPQADSAGTA